MTQTTTDRDELIERLEKASGPDRNLDFDILFATFPGDRVAIFDGVKHISTMTGADGTPWFLPLAERDDCPWFTASIDAALTLVPDFINRRWYMADSDHNSEGKAVASVYHPADILNGIPRSVGATPAIALCIAALRSRATSERGR